ncbi:MAG: peptidase M23 [Parcubacteria group bacterium Gr01-1014_66]|nr:MAG: peptidase M23 [Parcubacteria group bacterium Gr01-1014_66]
MYMIVVSRGNGEFVFARTLEEYQQEITKRHEEIHNLEEEAKELRAGILIQQHAGKTLQQELKRIDQIIGSLKKDIALTERQMQEKELEIQATNLEIWIKGKEVATHRMRLGKIVKTLAVKEGRPLLGALVSQKTLSSLFGEMEHLNRLQKEILLSVRLLKTAKQELEIKKANADERKNELEALNDTLHARRGTEEQTKGDKQQLLTITKNQEKRYQQMLTEQEKKRRALQEEVAEIERQIRVVIDQSRLPHPGSGVLGFPLPNFRKISCWGSDEENLKDVNCLTQFFGDTDFARSGAYNRKGHNGIDVRADIGEEVWAAEAGIVEGIGDTDVGCRGVSYGKWVLIRHPNNLSTLYAHMSGISVAQGQSLSRGQRIGASGKSGYATGPHLHFTVFATQAVHIETIQSKVCGTPMTLPIAATNGYLNPLDYL